MNTFKPNKASVVVIIIVAVIVLAAIAGGSYLIVKKQSEQPEEEELLPEEEDEFADWKTYRNEEHGVEIKYPPDLVIEEWGWPGAKVTMTPINTEAYAFCFARHSNPQNLTLREFREKRLNWPEVPNLNCILRKTENIVFGKEQFHGIKFTFDSCTNPLVENEIIMQILTERNGDVVEFHGTGSASDEEFMRHFNQILSTFKFLE